LRSGWPKFASTCENSNPEFRNFFAANRFDHASEAEVPMCRSLVLIPFLASFCAGAALAEDTHWSYGEAAHWGEISAEFASCLMGDEQSPIDLSYGVVAVPDMVAIHWTDTAEWEVVNNGHTIQLNAENAGFITIADEEYELLQFHFHLPSEHAVDGERAPMEVHFVHKAKGGGLAVIGVLMVGGGENAAFDKIMVAAPHEHGEAALGEVDLASLLPETQRFYRYHGSLTTPPCSEIVLWTVMQEPVAVSDAAIAAFGRIFEMNARPLQMVNRRFLLRG
jgi:carbonic anhydrase